MLLQVILIRKTLLTLSTWVQLFPSMCLLVMIETSFTWKPFVTHCTHIRSSLVIMWIHSDIITISFNLRLNRRTFTCVIYTTTNITWCNSESEMLTRNSATVFHCSTVTIYIWESIVQWISQSIWVFLAAQVASATAKSTKEVINVWFDSQHNLRKRRHKITLPEKKGHHSSC